MMRRNIFGVWWFFDAYRKPDNAARDAWKAKQWGYYV